MNIPINNDVVVENIVEGKRVGAGFPKTSSNMLMFADYANKSVVVPKVLRHWRNRTKFPVYDMGNGDNGDCGIASQALFQMKLERLERRRTIMVDKDEILRVYYNLTERLYGGGDTGIYEVDGLSNWRNPDLTFRDAKGNPLTIDAYTKVNHFSVEEVKKAIFLSGGKGIKVCFALPMAWANTLTWDYQDQQLVGEWQKYSWGGHCLHKNTIIHLLDGRNVPIHELEGQEDIWVYGCLPNAQPYPVKAAKCVKTKFAKMVRVHIDNGSHIELTPEHLVMLRDGTYKKAGELQAGDRLMPLRRIIHHRGYEKLKWYDEGKKQTFTHRMIAEALGCPKDKVAHHQDSNKRNNHPDNIKFLSVQEHVDEHKFWEASKTFNVSGWSILWDKCQECGTTEKKHRGKGLCLLCWDRDYRMKGKLENIPQEENHKVLSVEEGEEGWVYDLLDCSPTHNFAANGIFVHNSMTAAADYDETWLYLDHTWNCPIGKISWKAFLVYATEVHWVIDSINAWKKRVSNKDLNLSAIKSDVNSISDQKIK